MKPMFIKFFRGLVVSLCLSSSYPGDEAVTDVFRQLLVVHQLLQENTAGTQRDKKEDEERKERKKKRSRRGTRGRR